MLPIKIITFSITFASIVSVQSFNLMSTKTSGDTDFVLPLNDDNESNKRNNEQLTFIYQNYSRVHRNSDNGIIYGKSSNECGGTFKTLQTTIQSPDYPNIYQPNSYCEYIFKSPFVCKNEFHIQFLFFSLESSKDCVKDYLKIGKHETLCGKVIGIMKYKAMDGVLKIVFAADNDNESLGFKLLVTRLPCSDEESSTKFTIDEEQTTEIDEWDGIDEATTTENEIIEQSTAAEGEVTKSVSIQPLIPTLQPPIYDHFGEMNNKSYQFSILGSNTSDYPPPPSTDIHTTHTNCFPVNGFPSSGGYPTTQYYPFPNGFLPPGQSGNNFPSSNGYLPPANGYIPPGQSGNNFPPSNGYFPPSNAHLPPGQIGNNFPVSNGYFPPTNGFIPQGQSGNNFPSSNGQFPPSNGHLPPGQSGNNFPTSNGYLPPANGYIPLGQSGNNFPSSNGYLPPDQSSNGFLPPSNGYFPPGQSTNSFPSTNGYLPPSNGYIPQYPNQVPNTPSNYPTFPTQNDYPQNYIPNTVHDSNIPVWTTPSRDVMPAQMFSSAIPQCCTRQFNQQRFYVASPNFPSKNSRNVDCLHYINRNNPNVCRIRIEFKFFLVGNHHPQFGCADNFIEIDGQRVCGCRSGMRYVSQWGFGSKIIRVVSKPGVAQNVRGFLLDVIQEQCPQRISKTSTSDGNETNWDRSDAVLQKALTQTNTTSLTTYYYFEDNSDNSIDKPTKFQLETNAEFEQRAEGPNSRFIFPPTDQRNNRCDFSYLNWIQLLADPLWLIKPTCQRG